MTDLGKRLKERREEKKLSLDDLQRITKIQKRYLVGIEEGNYSAMPGKFYVRAFIKQYAEAVGLNHEELFEEFSNEIPSTPPEQLPEQLSRVRSKRQISTRGSKILDMVPVLLLAVFILGSLFTIWWWLQKSDITNNDSDPTVEERENSQYQETTEIPDEPVDEQESNNDIEEETPAVEKEEEVEEAPSFELNLTETSGNTSTFDLENTSEFTVDIAVSDGGETWLDITNQKGNQFAYEMMRDGATKTFDFKDESQIIFNVGNTIDTKILINGEEFEYPINPSEIVKQFIIINFSPEEE
ncbi:helix-turn-helix domain-containing protein [Litchfieldia alkalitelluris]|uniref:helix-turn-helix domain-containing protein n=1 Tax=Litchfieldia alkalitelluris TaxID=304268 RepID=UPI001475218B|nr:RodZ family helix-turn-helix domain-containing protein [Litchfieldia alkalitelluris]